MDQNKELTIKFLGGAGTVTGSNFLVSVFGRKILIDCGLFQGHESDEERNFKGFSFEPREIEFLFVTHAHLDHVGRIPKLVKEGFRGKIFSTPETKRIARFILEDALKVMEYRQKEHKSQTLLYSSEDIQKTFELWQTARYGEKMSQTGFDVVFKNSGHILGSAMVLFDPFPGKGSLVFSGDIGNWPNPLLQKAEKLEQVKYLVMESVYGDREHGSFVDQELILKEAVEEVIKKSGTLLIPAFSLERTQAILFTLNNLVENKTIPQIPVFLDSPLAIKLTEIYKDSKNLFNEKVKKIIESGDSIFSFPGLKISETPEGSKQIIDIKDPKIIIAGSGMSEGGRIIFHEKEYLRHKNNTLLLLGYQSIGSLGRSLQEGVKRVKIKGEIVPVKAEVKSSKGFSGHLDSNGLLKFVSESGDSLKEVFLVMGEPKSSLFLAQRIKDYLGIKCRVPKEGEELTLKF